jgi:hypothetical protein
VLESVSFYKKEVVVKMRRHLITIVIMCHIELPTHLHWLKIVYFNKKEPSTEPKARKTINYTNKKLLEL